MDRIKIFEQAFRSPRSSMQETCGCGRIFFDFANSWDWEDGEQEALLENPNATALLYSVECVSIDGKEYVIDCDCWHEKATRIMGWIDAHDDQLVEFFKLDKERLETLARNAVVIEVKYSDYKDGWRHIPKLRETLRGSKF